MGFPGTEAHDLTLRSDMEEVQLWSWEIITNPILVAKPWQ
jgi:hypothetical protein